MPTYTATYSPDDNKLRLYASSRLDAETYERVKAAGFRWAPRQELFVAPMWTPHREDLLIELAGEIGDEDTSLTDRAEERADRFDDYSTKRASDAERAREAVSAIADNIPLGQPILVGHHSEKHARRDAEKIESGMRKAVKMWDTSQYWTRRAEGALAHAKYKELPTVRARRIKTIEADQRKAQRTHDKSDAGLKLWTADGLTMEQAKLYANAGYYSAKFPLDKYPRNPPTSQYEGDMSLWSALDGGIITAEQARDLIVPAYRRSIASCLRWLAHYSNRLAYERAMLEEAGASDLLKPKPRAELLPICNYRAPDGIAMENKWNRGEVLRLPQIEMTKAEYARINNDYRGARVVENSHRVRVAMRGPKFTLSCVFLTDSKVHEKPAKIERAPRELPTPALAMERSQPAREEPNAFDAMKASLKAGVQVVTAPQLFPTPVELAERMVEAADIQPGHRVLEPSSGTGRILAAIRSNAPGADLVHVEIDRALCISTGAINRDFLQCNGDLGHFDRVLMNPPFADGQDMAHILHAWTRLKPGGRLVAICGEGAFFHQHKAAAAFRSWLDSIGAQVEQLPAGTFAKSGTGVVSRLIMADKAEGEPALFS